MPANFVLRRYMIVAPGINLGYGGEIVVIPKLFSQSQHVEKDVSYHSDLSMRRQLSIVPFLILPPRKYANGGSSLLPPLSKYADRTKSLHQFSNLPCEVRWMIWEQSLEPRIVEIGWTQCRGFYSRFATPPAFGVNRDSRIAVAHFYTICFGNPMRPPKTLFNFNLDVLYLSDNLQNETLQFFAGLAPVELDNLQHIAVAEGINEDWEHGGKTDDDSILALKQIIPRLKSLKMVSVAFELEYNYEGNDECRYGPRKIYAQGLPSDFHHDCGPMREWLNMVDTHEESEIITYAEDAGEDDDDADYAEDDYLTRDDLVDDFPADLCNCNELPNVPEEFKIIKGPELQTVWVWRPDE